MDDETQCTSSAEWVAYLKDVVKDGQWGEPWYSAAMELDPEKVTIAPNRLSYMADLQRFDNRGGRMTLAGDAAHTMPPHRGQGLNNATLDAGGFINALQQVVNGFDKIASDKLASDKSESETSTSALLSREITAYDAEV